MEDDVFDETLALFQNRCYTVNNDTKSVQLARKPPELLSPGVFYSIFTAGLDRGSYVASFLTIEPFANVICDYICRDGAEQ